MKKQEVFKKASACYLIGNMFNKGMAFLTVPIFTRLLSTSDYGIVNTYSSWIAILSMVIGFALHMGIRSAFIDYKDKIDDFVSVTTTFTVLSGLIFGSFIFWGCMLIPTNLNTALIVLCLLQGIAVALMENYSMYLMMQYRYKFRTVLMILPNLLSVAISIVTLLFILKTDRYLGRIVPNALIQIVFGIIILVCVYRKSHMFVNKSYLRYGLRISAPLVLHGVALNILSQSDRMMITWLADSSQTGVYSLVYNYGMLATVVTTSLDGVWVPWFTDKLKEKEMKNINIVAKDYIFIMSFVMAVFILVGPEAVKLLASEKYWDGIVIIPPVVLAYYFWFSYTLYINIEHFYKRTNAIAINTIIAAIANIILNYFLIPYYGYIAAAFSTLISYMLAFILHSAYAKKLEPQLYPLRLFFKPLLSMIVVSIVFYLFRDMWIVRWITLIVYALVTVIIKRNQIMKYFPYVAVVKNKKFK